MVVYNSQHLLDELSSDVRAILVYTEKLKPLTEAQMNRQSDTGGWSTAQVLAHLNFYCNYYLPEIEKTMSGLKIQPAQMFKSGWLGNYFTNMMKLTPDGQVKKKIKAPKNAIPSEILNAKEVLEEFILHQHHLLNILEIARSVDLNKNRIPISISRLIKLKLGDTFLFFVAHEQRHMQQIKRGHDNIKI